MTKGWPLPDHARLVARWFEKTTGQAIRAGFRHPVLRWMAATLDGIVEGTGAVFEAKFMLPGRRAHGNAMGRAPALRHRMHGHGQRLSERWNAASSCSSREAWSSRNRRSTDSRFQRSRRLNSARVMPVSRSCR